MTGHPVAGAATLWVVAPLAAGAAELAAGWSGPGALALLVVCAVGPVVLIGGCLRIGIPAWLATLLPTVLGGGVTLLLAANAAQVAAWREIGRSVRTLLAVPSPAHGTAVLLLPGVLLCLVAGSVAGVRLHIARRGRVAGVAAGVVLYAGGELLTAGTGDTHGLLAAALLAVALLGWQRRGAGLSARVPVVLAVVPVLVAALGTPAGGYQPRAHVSQPRTILPATDPLAALTLWTEHPATALFTASVTGTNRLQVATLDSYNGQGWQDDGSFVPLDQYAAPDLPTGRQRVRVTATVKLGQLGGPLLPTVSGTTGISNPAGLLDPSSGDAAILDGAAPGFTYSVTGTKPNPAPAALAGAVEPVVPAGYLDVPAPPTALTTYAKQATSGALTPLQQAVALEAAVAQGRSLKADAPGGSGYSRLLTFLFRPTGEGGQSGNSEQFASAFAVLGRLIGLPTRLVVGFQLPSSGTAQQTVTGALAQAWPEVYLGGAGWLPFDPTPGAAGSSDAAVRNQVLAKVQPAHTPPPQPPPAKVSVAAPAAPVAAARSHTVGIAVGAALAALVLAAALLLGRREAGRRRRRRAGAPGAWADVLVLQRRTGVDVTPGTSGDQIAETFGVITPQARELALLVVTTADEAAFSRPPHVSGSPPDPGQQAWTAVRELRREVRRHRRVRTRRPSSRPAGRRR